MMTYVSSVRYVDGPERISRSSSNNIPIFRIFLSLDLPIGELWPVTQPGGEGRQLQRPGWEYRDSN